MKKLAIAFVLVFAVLASAASFTLTLTNAQVSAIQFAYNAAPDKLSFGSAQLWFANQLNGVISGYETAQAQANASSFCVKFMGLTQTNRDNICSNLGLANGCSCQ